MARLRDSDSAEQVNLLAITLRIGPVVLLGLLGIEYFVWGPHFLWFLVPDVALTALVVWGSIWLLHYASSAAGTIYLGRNPGTPLARPYSEQEALVIQGRHAEAVDSYRAIIADDPGDNEARLRLARLLEGPGRDAEGAERCYREVREHRPTAQQEWLATNGLIDLYERERNFPLLRKELARLASRHHTTEIGAAARRRLKALGGAR